MIINGIPVEPTKVCNTFVKTLLYDQNISFNYKYRDLAYNSMIAISIWCSAKNRDEKRPLGSTTITLFDENHRMREGKFHLYIWPNTLPDFKFDSTTPGLVLDKNM